MAYLTFQLADGTKVYVESVDAHKNNPGLIPAGRSPEAEGDKSLVSFEEQIDGVRKMAATLMQNFREGFGETPSDIDISFGLKASAELGGFMVARGGSEASYSVSLHWREKDKEKKSE
jgi:hypothetical protein